MKKILFLIAGGVLLACTCMFIYSCSKKVDDGTSLNTIVPDDLLKAAQNWHVQQTQGASTLGVSNTKQQYILPPTWKEAQLHHLNNGQTEIIAPSPDFPLDSKSDRGALRKFVFTVEGDQVTGGRIIEIYGSADTITSQKDNLIEKYTEGKMAGFTGAVITYDVNYKYIKGEIYKNGVKLNGTVTIGHDHGQHKNKKNALGTPITTLDNCYDVYYVTTYWDVYPPYQNWEYLYSYCNSSGGNNEYGGGGDGGSGGTTTGGNYNSSLGIPTDNPGDHHLTNTTKLPPAKTTNTQVANLCVFKTMEWVSGYLGNSVPSGTSLLAFLQANPNATYVINNTAVPVDFQFILDHGIPDIYINGIFSTYLNFTTIISINVAAAIDANHPVMGAIDSGAHEVMITGYNNDGTFTYFDPAQGDYFKQPASNFIDIKDVSSNK